ncbi:MAG TPA: DEAD/DEAH box helicase, partial [Acidimicrobiales bacterium]|nr:DEAD/DEAH box helicase [Acidimicrobiales bacterium]
MNPSGEESGGIRLDKFQREAIEYLDKGMSVMVSAPTGSGKTQVALHAIRIALSNNKRAFYTTPLKALSNQKFGELRQLFGVESVGLLTGDIAVNSDAPIVVMTTEILRNMIYERSDCLDELSHVVVDEVHYLQNPYRGGIWEEVIIHTPGEVIMVCLSATVSNAEEFGEWLRTVREGVGVVVETLRPVKL